MSLRDAQTYTATVEFKWSSEIFEGDPDDIFQLAELEKEFLGRVAKIATDSLDPDTGSFQIKSVTPLGA